MEDRQDISRAPRNVGLGVCPRVKIKAGSLSSVPALLSSIRLVITSVSTLFAEESDTLNPTLPIWVYLRPWFVTSQNIYHHLSRISCNSLRRYTGFTDTYPVRAIQSLYQIPPRRSSGPGLLYCLSMFCRIQILVMLRQPCTVGPPHQIRHVVNHYFDFVVTKSPSCSHFGCSELSSLLV